MSYLAIIVLGISTRLLPHLPNFTAVAATALFSGYYIKDKRAAFSIPLLIMLISDFFLGFYQWQLMLATYTSFAIVVILGIFIQKQKWHFALPTSLIGSVLFFLLTNWAVWKFGGWYPADLSGLMTSYMEGLPFLKNSLLGDFVYTLGFFGSLEILKYLSQRSPAKLFYKVLLKNPSL